MRYTEMSGRREGESILLDNDRFGANAVMLRLYARALDAAINGIVITDATLPDHPIIYANSGFVRLTGYPLDAIIGRNCRFLQGPDTDPAARATIRTALAAGSPCRVVMRNYRLDGTPFWNELTISPVADTAGRVTHFIGVQADVTELRETLAHLEHVAMHDALTGLANREAFMGRLEELQALGIPFAVLFVDLDGFKRVNDEAGHHAGDQVLQAIAGRLRDQTAEVDMVARIGGDEFACLLIGEDREQRASESAERIRRGIAAPLQFGEYVVRVGASVGMATEQDAMDGARVLRLADAAMYRAKAGRLNR